MTMEISLALLAFSAPITAGIFVFRPQRNGNGKYLTTREHDSFKADMGDRFTSIEGKIDGLSNYVKSRLP